MKSKNLPIIHLALVDDHTLFRKGLCGIIQSFGGFEIDFEVDNGIDFIKKLKKAKRPPDICLIDISMKGMNGYDTLKEVRAHFPLMKSLIVTAYVDEFAIMRMLRIGANGYILKNCQPEDIKKALLSIYETGLYHYELISNRVYQSFHSGDKTFPKITDLEYEFLKHCCNPELTYKEIGLIMGKATRTVEGYRDDLFEKLKVNTRIGLVVFAIGIGLVSCTE